MTDIYEEKIWTRRYPKNYPLNIEIPSLSALDLFERSARKNPENPALHYFDETLSYEGLNDLSDAFAAGLSDLGIRKGDRVILLAENHLFKITTLGETKEEGRKGERIKLINLSSKKEVYGRVINSNTVQIDF